MFAGSSAFPRETPRRVIDSPPPRTLTGPGRHCDIVKMKNITVAVDDDVYRKAKIRAAELGTSVSAVVRRLLGEFAGGESDFEHLKKLQDRTLSTVRAFRAADRVSRDAAHQRDTIR